MNYIIDRDYCYNLDLCNSGRTRFVTFWKPSEENGVFSQWYRAPIKEDGILFTCCEQYMMYHKALLFKDTETASEILECSNPKDMKALGRKIKNFNQKIWDENKYDIVYQGNYLKFSQNENLHKLLVEKYDDNTIFIEASPYDKVWGVGLSKDACMIEYPEDWPGENLLGCIIMHVRKELTK